MACAGLPTGTPPPHAKRITASNVAPAKRQLPVGVSKSVRDPNGGAVALRDLSAIDAPNQYLAQDHARSEIRSQASYSDAGSSVSPASSIARSAASSSLGKRPRAVAPSANPASPPPSFFTPADDQSLRDLVRKHWAEGDCDWSDLKDLTEEQAEHEVFWQYQRAKKRYRRWTRKPNRRARRPKEVSPALLSQGTTRPLARPRARPKWYRRA